VKLLFATLLCHRDVEIFKFNWFISRMFLDHGFDQPHLILNDGSLTEDDMESLLDLQGIKIDQKPITLHPIPNPILTAKIQLFDRGFELCQADRVVIFDPDVFFYKPWDLILKKILLAKAICLKDWGSSLGPNINQYFELFGVTEDEITPNCNTGIYSIPKKMHNRLPPIMEKHIKTPFQIMEDQGIFFAAFYGDISYINEVKCLINGIEEYDYTWSHILNNNIGAHLQGMRVRPKALQSLVNHCINCCPKRLHLSQITPTRKFIHGPPGNLAPVFGAYDFTKTYQEYPSMWEGRYILDGMHMHGGSCVEWQVPFQCTSFESQFICMHTGIPSNCRPCRINGQEFRLGDKISIPLKGLLKIETEATDGSHLCFLNPILKIKIDPPSLHF
jgi:hypothetical protein